MHTAASANACTCDLDYLLVPERLTRRPQTWPCSMLCHAMPCHARHAPRCHPHFIGMGARKETPQLSFQSDSSNLEPAKKTRPIVRDPLPLLQVKPPRPNNIESRKRTSISVLLRRIRSLPISYNTCSTHLIRMLPHQDGRLICRPSAYVCIGTQPARSDDGDPHAI